MLSAKANDAPPSLTNGRDDIAASTRRLVGNKPNIFVTEGSFGLDPTFALGVEESFDPVASEVEIRARIAAIAFRWDVRPSALFHGELPDPVGVIASVCKQH